MASELIALLGVAASGLLAAVGYLWKIAYERRRTTRTVLFYLLELHHWQARVLFGVNHFPKEYLERSVEVLRRRGIELEEAQLQALQAVLAEMVRNLALADVRDLRLRISEPYEKALVELARDDPFLAFELRGKDNIASVDEKLERAFAEPPLTTEVPVDLASYAVKLRGSLEDFDRSISMDELGRCVRATARRCGPWTYLVVRRHLNRAASVQALEHIDPEFAKKSQELIEHLVDGHVVPGHESVERAEA